MSALIQRLATELRTRGFVGFVRFIGLRLVQWRADVLYEIDLSRLPGEQAEAAAIVVVDQHSLGSEATRMVENEVLSGPNHAYQEALRGEDQLLALVDSQGHVRSYGFVLYESFYKQVLGETRGTPMISNCYTLPEHRGQGLYPQVLQASCRFLARQGHRRAIITCAPDNIASVRGIEKAGFRRMKTISSLVLAARWIAFQRNKAGGV